MFITEIFNVQICSSSAVSQKKKKKKNALPVSMDTESNGF